MAASTYSAARVVALETTRLRLSPFGAADLPLLAELHGDPAVQRYLSAGDIWNSTELQSRLDLYRTDFELHGWSKLAVFERDGTFVGRAGFSRFDNTGELELGFSFKQAVWGRGYASEVGRALLAWIFETTDEQSVIAFAAADNFASRAVLSKLGMEHTHEAALHGQPFAFYRYERP